jgi:hypothetical protein
VLKTLYVDNYRCLSDFTLELGRETLLLGYNGSGKSSVFDVLAAVRKLAVSRAPIWEAFPFETRGLRDDALQVVRMGVEGPHGVLVYELQVAHDGQTRLVRESLVRPDGERLLWVEPGRAAVTRNGTEEHYPGLKMDFSLLALLDRREDTATDEFDWFIGFLEGLVQVGLTGKQTNEARRGRLGRSGRLEDPKGEAPCPSGRPRSSPTGVRPARRSVLP